MLFSLAIDKGTAFLSVGITSAICACFMLKNGIERLINGPLTPHDKNPRRKGTILTLAAITMLTFSLIIILESDALAKMAIEHLSIFKN